MKEHPCKGCIWFYAYYEVNRCCNYLLDTGKKRPCPFGEGCTVKVTEVKETAPLAFL